MNAHVDEIGRADVIIVGAGSAGCVLANRLSEDPSRRVIVLEAGPRDRGPAFRMPFGFGQTLFDPRFTWLYEVAGKHGTEKWRRGRVLGGSSAVNGMIYVRGQPHDYEDWAARGLTGWGWSHMREAFRSIEDHALGDDGNRGVGGPLHVSVTPERHPLASAFVEAGASLGLPVREDLNQEDQRGIGFFCRTIEEGRRVSAADAFLRPSLSRPNLTVLTGVNVDRVRFADGHAVGVEARRGNERFDVVAESEVIICAGAIESPLLLQRSGVGPGSALQSAGISVVADNPGVGRNLREHRLLPLQVRVPERLSLNRSLSGVRVAAHLWRYFRGRRGRLASAAYDAGAFICSTPSEPRPDAELLFAPFSRDFEAGDTALEGEPGAQCMVHAMRPDSQGTVAVSGPGADDAPRIDPNYLDTQSDRRVSIGALRFARKLIATPPFSEHASTETLPGASIESDEDVIEAFRSHGTPGYHAVGTCAMGSSESSAVDPHLRVRGVTGLKVMDASVLPTMVSGNTNGPIMAMAWRAVELWRSP